LSHPLASPGAVVEVGPFRYRLISSVRTAAEQWDALYRGYPRLPATALADFRIGLEPPNFLRRFVRPNVLPDTDVAAPFQPIPKHQALVGFEMAMNWQTALGSTRFLTLHAASIARGKESVILTGASGSGKSTLAAGLGWQGWRFMSDEFVLLSPETGDIHPYPRPTSLKNESVSVMKSIAPQENFSPVFTETHKGTICYLRPAQTAIDHMQDTATPRAIVFPQYTQDEKPGLTFMEPEEAFVRLVAGSANYDRLGEAGFATLVRLVQHCPAAVMAYGNFAEADAMLQELLSKGNVA
jgi:HprK-related kinase A